LDKEVLQELMQTHGLNDIFEIYGHSHVVLKGYKNLPRISPIPIIDMHHTTVQSKPIMTMDDMHVNLKSGSDFSKPSFIKASKEDNLESASTDPYKVPQEDEGMPVLSIEVLQKRQTKLPAASQTYNSYRYFHARVEAKGQPTPQNDNGSKSIDVV
jgi:hypothetical protein